jgi:hypothetical protein
LHERDLSRWIARRDERDNPIHVHSHVEAQKTRVELPALMNLVAGDIWYNSSDAHRIPFFLGVGWICRSDILHGAIVLMFCAILTVNGKMMRRLHKIRVNSDNKQWAQYTKMGFNYANKSISNS